MSEKELRDQFVEQAKSANDKLLQFLSFVRLQNGEFVELAAEAAFVGWRLGLEHVEYTGRTFTARTENDHA